jgi:hypothetical protein
VESIVFDVDDFCNKWMCLDALYRIKAHYRNFKATLFTIPLLTTIGLAEEVQDITWIELAMHGFTHVPNKELESFKTVEQVEDMIWQGMESFRAWGFKPPGWFITDEAIKACNNLGLWVALHHNDKDRAETCEHGYYICGERYPYWHGHSHDVCDNWVDAKVDEILKLWPKDQTFIFVSEAIKGIEGHKANEQGDMIRMS